jgi:hypothetical protein
MKLRSEVGISEARVANLSAAVLADSPAQSRKFIGDETEKWGRVIRASGTDFTTASTVQGKIGRICWGGYSAMLKSSPLRDLQRRF